MEHSFYGKVNSAISFYRGGYDMNGFMTFSTRNTERMRIDADGNVSFGYPVANGNVSMGGLTATGNVNLGSLRVTNSDIQITNPVYMNGKTVYFHGSPGNAAGIFGAAVDNKSQLNLFGRYGVTLGYTTATNLFEPVLNINSDKVGIGPAAPKAFLDVNNYCNGGKLSAVLGRLVEGNRPVDGDGTYLGVRGFTTQNDTPYYEKAFTLEHSFFGKVNSSISFYRGWSMEGGYMTFSTDHNIERMRIDAYGKVGLGTKNAEAGLDIDVAANKNNGRYAYISPTRGFLAIDDGRRSNRVLSILAHADIATNGEFILYSDARIKNKAGVSDSKNDLSLLNKLRVTDYTYIDKVVHGNDVKKGFIAQEVEEVFPQAVSRGNEYVPDIYAIPAQVKKAGNVVAFTMKKAHHLVSGDVVKIMTAEAQETDTVSVTGTNTFTIHHNDGDYKDAFVYGKRVTDFRMVDYDRLFTLNVSATQELSKEVNAQNLEISRLKAENEKLQSKLDKVQLQVDKIIANLGSGDNTMTASIPK